MLEAFRRGDYDSALSAYSPDGEYDFTHLADGRLVRDREGVRSEVTRWAATWDGLTMEYELVGTIGEQVVIVVEQTGTGKGSGAPMEMRYGQVFTVRDGAIVGMRTHLDPDDALASAGLDQSKPASEEGA